MIEPRTAKTPKRAAFRKIKKKAFLADLQKLVPINAIWMYAFLFKNLRHFSKHHMEHWRHLMIITMTLFFCAWKYFSRYFRTSRAICTTAMMKAPKASDPRW